MDNEYMADYSLKRYYERRAKMIEILGGECVQCGETDDLEIDHKNPEDKEIDLGKEWNLAWERIVVELKKCQLLCWSCHKVKSDREISVDHGKGLSGKRNCKCRKCKDKKNKYMKDYWKTHTRVR